MTSQYINNHNPDKLEAIFVANADPNKVYLQFFDERLVRKDTSIEDNVSRCIQNPLRYIDALNNTTPHCSCCITSKGTGIDFDNHVCDEVADIMYCTMTANGARPNEKLLTVFSIDETGKIAYYPWIVSGWHIVFKDSVTERYTIQDLQCICKMFKLSFPFLI